jgi:hypothetical protein
MIWILAAAFLLPTGAIHTMFREHDTDKSFFASFQSKAVCERVLAKDKPQLDAFVLANGIVAYEAQCVQVNRADFEKTSGHPTKDNSGKPA